MKLTIKEIIRLAEFAGLEVDTVNLSDDETESEITIMDGPEGGFFDGESLERYAGPVAYFSEYPEEGCCPLGEVIVS